MIGDGAFRRCRSSLDLIGGADSAAGRRRKAARLTLRLLRSQIASLLSGDVESSDGMGAVSTSFGLSETGQLRLEPAGDGWQWLASALWGETLLSQATDTWRRLKQCRNPACRSAFYDRSKNGSGVWHNVKTCGNAANLRASRARRRENTPTGGEE